MKPFVSNQVLRRFYSGLLIVTVALTGLELLRPTEDMKLLPPVLATAAVVAALMMIRADRDTWARWTVTGAVVISPGVGMLTSGTIDAIQPVVIAATPIFAAAIIGSRTVRPTMWASIGIITVAHLLPRTTERAVLTDTEGVALFVSTGLVAGFLVWQMARSIPNAEAAVRTETHKLERVHELAERSKEELASLEDSVPGWLMTVDLDTDRIIHGSSSWSNAGLPSNTVDLSLDELEEYFNPRDARLFKQVGRADALNTGQRIETTNHTWLEMRHDPRRGAESRRNVILFMDVTNEMHAKRALSSVMQDQERARRMSSFSKVAGEISHRVNNALTSMHLEVWLANSQLDDSSETSSVLADLRATLDEAKAAAERLRALSVEEIQGTQYLELTAWFETTSTSLREVVPENIDLTLDVDCGDRVINMDDAALKTVLVSLIENSVEAMTGDGSITVRASCDQASFRLSVIDDGEGMSPQDLEQCQDLFFSTKPEQRVGMGLTIVHGHVRRAAGEMDIQSEPGAGTQVEIVIPLGTRPRPSRPSGEHPTGEADTDTTKDRSILIVDDEDALRSVICRVFTRDGWRVESARDGQEALRKYAPGKFDVVLTDVMMPKVSGTQVMREIRAVAPTQLILVMTGYAPEDAKVQLDEHSAVILKPFRPKKLINMARDLIEADRTPADDAS